MIPNVQELHTVQRQKAGGQHFQMCGGNQKPADARKHRVAAPTCPRQLPCIASSIWGLRLALRPVPPSPRHPADRLIHPDGTWVSGPSFLFGCPRPQLQHIILCSLLQRSDGEIWAPSISALTLRSILSEAFQQHVTGPLLPMWQQWEARWLLSSLTFPPPPPPPPLPFPPSRLPTSRPSFSTSTSASKPPPPPLSACTTPQASPPRR
eukprot:jgi/Mesvir1/14534/Mv26240-RA.1